MASGATPKLALPYPVPSDANNFPADDQALALAVEVVLGRRGLLASLPAAGNEGRYYTASDTGQIFRDNGTTWDELVRKASADAAYPLKANNLSDLASAAAARTNLGLAALATKATVAVPGDVTATGTPSAATFLRGDGAWATPPVGGNPIHLGFITPALANGSFSPAPANDAVYMRFRPQANITVTTLKLVVQTAAGNLDVGIYADASGAPGARLASTGSFVCPVAGAVSKTIAGTALTAGTDYWVAVAASSASVALVGGGNGVRTDTYADACRVQGSALPLPSTATPATNTGYTILPLLFISA
jgi:hypothetical protein